MPLPKGLALTSFITHRSCEIGSDLIGSAGVPKCAIAFDQSALLICLTKRISVKLLSKSLNHMNCFCMLYMFFYYITISPYLPKFSLLCIINMDKKEIEKNKHELSMAKIELKKKHQISISWGSDWKNISFNWASISKRVMLI